MCECECVSVCVSVCVYVYMCVCKRDYVCVCLVSIIFHHLIPESEGYSAHHVQDTDWQGSR